MLRHREAQDCIFIHGPAVAVKAIQKPLESSSKIRQGSGLFLDLRWRILFFSERNALKALTTPRSRIHPRAGMDIPNVRLLLGPGNLCVDSPFSPPVRGIVERAERPGHENFLLGGNLFEVLRTGAVCDRAFFLSFAAVA